MEISTFKVKVQKAVSEVLGQEYTVELREVQKNNGVLLQGLMIRKGQDNVTPTIYLNSFWEAYEGGVTFADIIKKIISIYKEDGIGRKIDVSFFQDFEKVKEKLCFRLVTDRDLLEIAVKNTPRLFPGETIPMEDVLGDTLQELPEEVRREFLRKVSMMILTNSRKTYGACSILYPGMLEQLAERIGGDYYMIPSSVHEFLLVPREREQDREELKKMIAEVNRTELPPEEVLSDHLYLYCSREREVRIV